ncbi:RHS repeat-associated core domain-containing protein [Hahella ganghwensis]|uniref:RHS repeat-associated core domain-containing protein n=1 Tax=Hahella ganghwensis TaxID=286420 RepID=UPI0003A88BA0|nr:RHS repeat-associated core domain-containing protein [Hahella ganghwensis]
MRSTGSRLTGTGSDSQSQTPIEHEYNDANQLTRKGNTYYHYDNNGHLISKGSDAVADPAGLTPDIRYIYNAEERLIRIENGAGGTIAEYGYNPFGHRMWKEVSGVRTYFLYNHSGMVGEYDASGNALKEYHYWPGATWMTQPMFQRDNGQVYYYQNDHLGTPQRMLTNSGAVVWEAEYAAFGEASVFVDMVSNNLRFPGQYFDAESGLHHNYFRDYDPALGRYVQSDPIGLNGGYNLYGYSSQGPISNIDPLGLWSVSVDMYYYFGGGLTFGQDPNGKGFWTLRFGPGMGGGGTYDPNGTSAAYDECYLPTGNDVALGVFAQGSVGILNLSANVEGRAGWGPGKDDPRIRRTPYGSFIETPNKTYSDGRGYVGLSSSSRFSALGALGIEITSYSFAVQ